MHIPDGFIDATTSAAAGVVAVGGLGVCVRKAAGTLDDRQAPMAGLAAAFIFAVQMLNFPVAAGTSGHLLGGVLAAVLVGPWAGALCVSVVLVIQSLLFADGGISALGLNVTNMALVGALLGYVVFRALRVVLPKTRQGVVIASGLAAFLSPMMAALAFVAQYAIGGNDAVGLGEVTVAMVGVHLLIGLGEGMITALTVSAVIASRPDLVAGARDLLARPAMAAAPAPTTTAVR